MKFFAVLALTIVACNAYPRVNSPKVVNGTDVKENEIPWQVSVQKELTNFHFCGGSIYNERWVICAAHCMDPSDDNVSNLRIEAGMIELGEGEFVTVDAVIRNTGYNRLTFENDISLLHLTKALDLDDAKFQAIKLPDPLTLGAGDPDPHTQAPIKNTYPNLDYDTAKQGTLFGLSGWGTTSSGGQSPTNMKKTPTVYITDENCNDPPQPAKPTDGYGDQVKEGMICAGGCGEGHDTCQGDSGGPMNLITESTSDSNYTISNQQIGIVSWGAGCAQTGKPGVYTQIAYYVKWIEDALKCYDDNGAASTCG